MAESAIVGTFSKIPKRESSHSYGWARAWSEMLGVDLDQSNMTVHDTVYLLHGANFTGGLNLFGGFTDTLKRSCDNLMAAKTIYSLEIDCPDYGAMLKNRKDVTDKDWCDRLSKKLSTAKTLTAHDFHFSHLSIGDSHTAAYAKSNSAIIKQDGTTLFGLIKSDFEYIRNNLAKGDYDSITISIGNIDIRHHVCRTATNLREDLIKPLKAFGDSLGIPVEYSLPWPIEFEGRKLPKTGYYKDKPFWGTRSERLNKVLEWEDIMHELGMDAVKCPQEWYNMDPTKYAKTHMEANQSVHLNPKYYRSENWGKPEIALEDFFF